MKAKHVTPAQYREKLRKEGVDKWNAQLRVQHTAFREQILALRPGWKPELLDAVVASYGTPEKPGLSNILDTIRAADALAARFGGG